MRNRVRVRMPFDTTVIIGPSGDQVTVTADEDGRHALMLESDIAQIIFSGLPASIPWREHNPGLVERLKPPSRTPAVRVTDLERAADMARPIDPFDRASIARDALAAWRRAR